MIELDNLWQHGKNFLGTEYAILGGAMSWVSEHNLVSAISNAGGFGVVACGSMPPHLLEQEIIATKRMTSKPFGVNLILMHPELEKLIDVCKAQSVSHIVLAGGIPKSATINQIKEAGIKVICFAPTLVVGKRLIKMGVDALVIEGMEAGGHIGQVSTLVLAQEILPNIKEVPVFVAGGIGRGATITNLLLMGAAGCQLGTVFVCTTESIAHPNFKQAFIRASARDAIASVQIDNDFPVIPVRALANEATRDFNAAQHQAIADYKSGVMSKEEAQLKIEHFWAGALKRAVIDGDTLRGSVMAGQSVGLVNQIKPTIAVIEELVEEAQQQCKYLSGIINI
jgi:enoyl-[acyl-carrier protein] reductase II